MEDLQYNDAALFTRWIVRENLLESPLVLVDVGVQGGEHARWAVFGECVDIYGFDPLPEVIEPLKERAHDNPRRHYYCMALGDEDKETRFYVNDANKTSSSMYLQGPTRFGDQQFQREIVVPMRRLDTLLAERTIPAPDFIKVDVEGFEQFVLRGATRSLSSCLGADVETGFSVSPVYPKGHFASMQEAFLEAHMVPVDIAFNRIWRSTFRDAVELRQYRRADMATIGAPGTLNALFSRDPIKERESPQSYPSRPPDLSVDQLIKILMILESYGLNDVAADIAAYYRSRLDARFDVDHAIDLLVRSALLNPNVENLDHPNVNALKSNSNIGRLPRHVSVRVALREGTSDVASALRGALIDIGISLVNSFRYRLRRGRER